MSKKMKYIVGTYVYGCIISLFFSGIPHWSYLLPIKMFGIIFGVTLGNAFYDKKELEIAFIPSVIRNAKYTIVAAIMLIVITEIKGVLLSSGIDISFFTAPF